ncbi:hypothetical protein RhiirA4_486825 [Rhizophagus irregularis]|uniref:Uncharacterized protein n=1 Tax=Rhizophagus irregularis TaxID=588596 RepID=A0A2I1HRX4_9GLOM|nr:hypothetical protein RhiirA4_464348 [Rhizophagus irregularis]PKY51442.1 hypothetical protein RhiirA4_468485 [Rhizophagus irregularis]PKY61616.1 hypothetical protein RhiirA4_486825 [Rhizophagus irregularis]
MTDLISYMINSHIHLLHVCETNLQDPNNRLDIKNHKITKNYFTLNNKQFLIIHNPDPSYNERINSKRISKNQWTDFHNFVSQQFQRESINYRTHHDPQKHVNTTYEHIQQAIDKTIKSLNLPKIKQNSHQFDNSYSIRIIQNDIHYINKLIANINIFFKDNLILFPV